MLERSETLLSYLFLTPVNLKSFMSLLRILSELCSSLWDKCCKMVRVYSMLVSDGTLSIIATCGCHRCRTKVQKHKKADVNNSLKQTNIVVLKLIKG